jgi:ribA/ribD-fused uncharacterized protein
MTPAGLAVLEEFVSAEEEAILLAAIDAAPWITDLGRRVQHYGYRYDYRNRSVDVSDSLGPLPEFLRPLVERVTAQFGFVPDQAIVNEYLPGQGIGRHIDCPPCFGPVVVSVGLGSSVEMLFERGVESVPAAFQRRSAVAMSGPARELWSHSIAKRKSDPSTGVRGRRVSVTFRTVKLTAKKAAPVARPPRSKDGLIAWLDAKPRPVEFFPFFRELSPLSQWHSRPFESDGTLYRTAEHWMMAEKARLFGDEEIRLRALKCHTPREAKSLGRSVRNFDENVWLENRYRIVLAGSIAKFSAHPDLRAFLLNTGNRILVEASPYDLVWGAGVASDDPRVSDPHLWPGENLLGFALMDARDALR